MKIYTKSGDKGRTGLIGGERVDKFDPRVNAYGSVDELSAHVAMLRDMLSRHQINDYETELVTIQRTLMSIEALLAVGQGGEDKIKALPADKERWLEERIDELSMQVPEYKGFTIVGGHVLVSQTDIARTVCRRAERASWHAASEYNIPLSALTYLNRLSDYFYTLGRVITQKLGIKEILW